MSNPKSPNHSPSPQGQGAKSPPVGDLVGLRKSGNQVDLREIHCYSGCFVIKIRYKSGLAYACFDLR